jgi:hypothetical protein
MTKITVNGVAPLRLLHVGEYRAIERLAQGTAFSDRESILVQCEFPR